jgi:hypothetical protein
MVYQCIQSIHYCNLQLLEMNCRKIVKFAGMNLDYTKLSIGEFDAVVTGELVHISLVLYRPPINRTVF